MQFSTQKESPEQYHKDIEFHVYAAMETGNTNRARTILTEYTDEYPEQAESLRASLTRDYGTAL